jgi:hypothetical protein
MDVDRAGYARYHRGGKQQSNDHVYKLAVAAVVSGHFSPGRGIVKFIGVSAGGVAIGLAAGACCTRDGIAFSATATATRSQSL